MKYHVAVTDFSPFGYAPISQRQFSDLGAAFRYAEKKCRKFLRNALTRKLERQNWGVTCGSLTDPSYRRAVITMATESSYTKLTH